MTAHGCSAWFAVVAALSFGAPVFAQSDEPPLDAAAGEDYESEAPDSLSSGNVEWTLSAAGRAGGAVQRRRRLRVESDSLRASLREGDADPLAGGALENRSGRGAFGVGKLTAVWGCGLVLGSPAEPWSAPAGARGVRAGGARASEAVWFRSSRLGGDSAAARRRSDPGRAACELVYGRFAKRPVAGVAVASGGFGVGFLGNGRAGQASVWRAGRSAAGEVAFDRSGRWRAELATTRAACAATIGLRVRAGALGFASFTEPRRNGPPVLLAAALRAPAWGGSVELRSAAWRHAVGAAGARAAFEWRGEWSGSALAIGAEERHGAQRAARTGSTGEGFRQGWWTEWTTGSEALRLAARQESWGARSWARETVRAITTGRIEVGAWAGSRLRLTHTIHRAKSGENLYVAERGTDRAVLRALSGRGERTRAEVEVPLAGGELAGSATFGVSGARRLDTRWSLEWTRRARLRRGGG